MTQKKFVFASAERVRELQTEVDELLFAIAKFMIEPGEDPVEWLSYCFVSDHSSLGDFIPERDLPQLEADLRLTELCIRDRLIAVASILRQRKSPN